MSDGEFINYFTPPYSGFIVDFAEVCWVAYHKQKTLLERIFFSNFNKLQIIWWIHSQWYHNEVKMVRSLVISDLHSENQSFPET